MSAEPTRLHLERPTIDHADIRWRVGQISKKDPHKGSLLGYIDARTCMEALDALPIPVEESGPVRCMVVVRDGEWRTAWGLSGCRRPEVFGPAYVSVRDAIVAAHRLNERSGS